MQQSSRKRNKAQLSGGVGMDWYKEYLHWRTVAFISLTINGFIFGAALAVVVATQL
jgi:hypothetical protein